MWQDDEPMAKQFVYDNYYRAESVGGYTRKKKDKIPDLDKHCPDCGIPIPNMKRYCQECNEKREAERKAVYYRKAKKAHFPG